MNKKRKKRSVIWSISKEDFVDLVNNSSTIGEVLAYFGMRNHGSNFLTLRRRFLEEEVDYSKFRENKGHCFIQPIKLEEILVVNSNYNRTHLKRRLIKNNLLEEKCAICGIGPIWNDKKLSLVLDHINGINNDNRLENLRLLCPNCNSQTDTFAGKNKKSIN